MKKIILLSLILAGVTLAGADTIHAGNYTVDYSVVGDMRLSTDFGIVRFNHNTVAGPMNPDETAVQGVVNKNGAIMATFYADPGFIFDKIYFGGVFGGGVTNDMGGAHSTLDWTVEGGVFTGPQTYGGVNSGPLAREWAITGPNTGHSFLYDGLWYHTWLSDFSSPVAGSGYYDIGASTFSINVDATIFLAQYGQWSGTIFPQGIQFGFSYLEAPPPSSSVPDVGATAGLLLMAMAGLVFRRHRLARA